MVPDEAETQSPVPGQNLVDHLWTGIRASRQKATLLILQLVTTKLLIRRVVEAQKLIWQKYRLARRREKNRLLTPAVDFAAWVLEV